MKRCSSWRRVPVLLLGLALTPSVVRAQSALPPPAQQQQSPAPAAPIPVGTPTTTDELPAEIDFPSLEGAVQAARERAPTVVVSRGALGVARAARVGASLSSIGNPYTEWVVNQGPRGVTQDISFSATLWMPLELWGQRRGRTNEAGARAEWAGANITAVRSAAASEAMRAYGTAIVEAERSRLLTEILETSRREATLYEERTKAGDATVQDSAQAAVEVARNAVALAESRADLQRALTDLARMIGVEVVHEPTPGAQLRPPGTEWADGRAAELAENSPTVGALRSEASYLEQTRLRYKAEARLPVSLMLVGGRGDLGEWRAGGGLALTLPFLRANQGEQALARAERERALGEAAATRRSTTAALRGLVRERKQVADALTEIERSLEPAGQAAVDAAVAMQKAGKGELLRVLTARRDLVLLRTRRLEMIRREWQLTSQLIALTGKGP
jgi:cobalt-zinc-cadmium efflux system outer membrane protein